MAAFDLQSMNRLAAADPAALIAQGDADYRRKVQQAAQTVAARLKENPVVLLSGPSSSGKTTTAGKLAGQLEQTGVRTHTVSLDDYYLSRDTGNYPRTPEGQPDYESPLCLDIPLLNRHLEQLARGEEVLVPHFLFDRQIRDPEHVTPLRLGRDEAVIFEGIHALNDLFFHPDIHPEPTGIYISALSDLCCGDEVVIPHLLTRYLRRTVRDHNYRGTSALDTARMWANVRRGEQLYITPLKRRAHLCFDTSLIYELPVLRPLAEPLLATLPDEVPGVGSITGLLAQLRRVEPAEAGLVPQDSLLREFI